MTTGNVDLQTETGNRNRQINNLLLVIVVALGVVGCDSNRVFEEYYATGKNGWNKDSLAVFQVDVESTSQNYNLYINSRNIENYPYQNLWLFLEIEGPSTQTIRDTVELRLAESNGKWLGKGTGGVYTNQFLYRQNVYFPTEGIFTVKVEHAMREDVLKGLKDIGIRLEKTE